LASSADAGKRTSSPDPSGRLRGAQVAQDLLAGSQQLLRRQRGRRDEDERERDPKRPSHHGGR
jgi:hypothetical protein